MALGEPLPRLGELPENPEQVRLFLLNLVDVLEQRITDIEVKIGDYETRLQDHESRIDALENP